MALDHVGRQLTNSSRATRLPRVLLGQNQRLGDAGSPGTELSGTGGGANTAVQGGDQRPTPNLERTRERATTRPFWGTCSITKSSQRER